MGDFASLAGLDADDFVLTRDGGPDLLVGSVQLAQVADHTYLIGGLTA